MRFLTLRRGPAPIPDKQAREVRLYADEDAVLHVLEADGTDTEVGTGGGGGSLPASWTEDGHGAVVAKTDGEDATPLKVEQVPGQTETLFVISCINDSGPYMLDLVNQVFGETPVLRLWATNDGRGEIVTADLGGSMEIGTYADYRLSFNDTGLVFFKDATQSVAQQNHISDPAGGGTQDAQARTAIGAILDALEAYGLLKTS